MKRAITITIALLVMIFFAWYLYNLQSRTEGSLSYCDSIDRNPAELTFELAYCMGDFCTATSRQECEAIDVINEEDAFGAGEDGIGDCAWDDALDPVNACQPNK